MVDVQVFGVTQSVLAIQHKLSGYSQTIDRHTYIIIVHTQMQLTSEAILLYWKSESISMLIVMYVDFVGRGSVDMELAPL